jgi:hypothetical protein
LSSASALWTNSATSRTLLPSSQKITQCRTSIVREGVGMVAALEEINEKTVIF